MADSGLLLDGIEQVDFPTCDLNSLDRGRQRLLYQLRNSCVLDQVLQCLSCECQELIDACCEILTKRILPDAEGVQQCDLIDVTAAISKARQPSRLSSVEPGESAEFVEGEGANAMGLGFVEKSREFFSRSFGPHV